MAEEFFERLQRLLRLEADAEARALVEKARAAADAGRPRAGLAGLVIDDESSGLGGRVLVTLTRPKRQPLPWSPFKVGSPVVLSEQGADPGKGMRGVVAERSELALVLAVSDQPAPADEDSDPLWRVDPAPDEIARERQRAALAKARAAKDNRLQELRDVLLGKEPPRFTAAKDRKPFRALDTGLDASQVAAVEHALYAKDLAVIHGPPGTGKTTALVELIRQAVKRGERVLACAPSNLAVDNLLERLLAHGEGAVRLGHPARVLPALREHTLDLMVENHPDVRRGRKLVREALQLFRSANKYTRAKPAPGERLSKRREARRLLDDARMLEEQAAQTILGQATVICATTTGLYADLLRDRRFGLFVLDEAAQTTEPGAWVPLPFADRVVLAGDHCQLPPTVVSTDAVAQGFAVSMMERLVALHGDLTTRRLNVQYRMHADIMGFSSQEFYDGTLIAAPSVADHRLSGLPGVTASDLTERPIQLIDTAGAGWDEELEPDGESRRNPEEAGRVRATVEALIAAGVPARDIGVITPYAAQVRLLRERLRIEGLEIDSVDGFQGREKEAIVVSLVRANPDGEIGFLADVRRMNVALTRARRKLVLIGDGATLASAPFYQRLMDYFAAHDAHQSVWDDNVY